MQPIRVLIADDHPTVRETIRDLLANVPDIIVVGEATNGIEALYFTQEIQPDVLLLDMQMPGLPGLDVARQLRAIRTSTRILVLSAYNDGQYIRSLLDYGAAGYLLKGENPETILAAIRGVARGETSWFSGSVAQQMEQTRDEESEFLLEREQEILKLVVEGQTNREISKTLNLPEDTVQKYLDTLFAKLGVDSRVTAAIRAVQSGIV